MIECVFEEDHGESDFINEEGVKWWLDKSGTHYAQKPDALDRALPHVFVWYVEMPDGEKEYVLIEHEDPIYSSKKYEDIGAKIDMLKIADGFKK